MELKKDKQGFRPMIKRKIFRSLGATLLVLVVGLTHGIQVQAKQQQNNPENLTKNSLSKKYQAHEFHAAVLQKVITIDLQNKTLEQGLQTIAGMTGLKLVYSENIMPTDHQVSLRNKNIKLEDALWALLDGTHLRFGVSSNDHLVVMKALREPKKKEQPLQPETVMGKVSDASSGETLPGVNILVKGTSTGASTDADGNYELTVESLQDTLVVSFVGYQTQEVPINGRTEVDIALQPQAITGEEMVVVGYGQVRKEDLTGSVSSVASGQLENASITTPDQALQGRVAGVNVHRNSNAPGGSITVSVRGTASIQADGTPLYVIDGIPISTSYQTGIQHLGGNGGTPNPLNSIDPSDIESIEVLKDASATAIYGSRGANGVILITTKNGVSGRQNVDFETSLGISQVSKKLKFLNAKQFAQQINDRQALLGAAPAYTDQQISSFGEGTEWQDVMFREPLQQKYKLTFSGGSDDVRYLVSGNLSDNEGVLRNSKLARYGAKINVDADVSNHLTVGTNINFTTTDDHRLSVDARGYGSNPSVIAAIISAPPTISAKDEFGDPTPDNLFGGITGTGIGNPLIMTDQYKQYANTNRLIGNLYADYDITENLYFRTSFATDIRNWRYHSYFPIDSKAAGNSNGTASQISELTVNVINSNTLTYQKNIRDVHSFKVLAGFTYQQQKDEVLNAESQGFPSDFYSYNNLGLGNNPQSPGSGADRWTLLSYLGRLNYSLYDKYLLTASFRIDGSSKFGTNNKYGVFPSFAVAWQLGKEKFIQNLNLFSHLKFRFGYGKTGNQSIGTYNSKSLISTQFSNNDSYVFGGTQVPIAYPDGVPNPDLSWEKTAEWNYGVDIGFFNERLSLSANYYYKKTTDMLLYSPIPQQTGFGSVFSNSGSMLNRGIGFELTSRNIQDDHFQWSTSFNISANRNKVLSLGGAGYKYTGYAGGGNSGPHGKKVTRLEPGHPVGNFYGSIYEGIWHSQEEIDDVGTMPTAKPGGFRYKDVNGDGLYDTQDDVFLGSANPDFNFGMTNDFSYKQFGLSVFLYGSYGNEVLNFPAERFIYAPKGTSIKRLQRWTPNNPNNPYPSAGVPYKMGRVNSRIVEDGSFLRIQNVTLSYSIPVAKVGLSETLRSAKIGVSVDNLAIFTNYSGYDPEVNTYGNNNATKGVDVYGYPASRTYRVNIKLGF